MRGQGPGSEHERREAGSAPPTPPPSFGRQPPEEQGGPPAYPDDPSGQAWLTVEGEPPRDDAWQPAGAAPAEDWLSVQESGPDPAASRPARPSDVREPTSGEQPVPVYPGAQPWEVQDADGAAYDWYAEDDEPAGVPFTPPGVPWPQPPKSSWGEPAVPGAPRWEPPPAFTAAAAGMQVWPTPVTGSPAMPPWPAATGELEPDDDSHAPHQSGDPPRPAGPADPSPPSDATWRDWPAQPPSEGLRAFPATPPPANSDPTWRHWPAQPSTEDRTTPPAGSESPDLAEGWGPEPVASGPSHYFDPDTMAPRPVPLSAPTPADHDAPPPPAREGQPPYGPSTDDPRPPYGVEPTRPTYGEQPDDVEGPTRPGQVPPFARKGGPGLGAGMPVPSPGPKGPPAPLFDPKLSPAAQQGTTAPAPGTAGPPNTGNPHHTGTPSRNATGTHPMSPASGDPHTAAGPRAEGTPHLADNPHTAGDLRAEGAAGAHGTGGPPGAPMEHAGRRAEPSDVPVWPPAPQREEPERDQLDLPFAPEVWGRRPAPSGVPEEHPVTASSAQHDEHPGTASSAERPVTPPSGGREERPVTAEPGKDGIPQVEEPPTAPGSDPTPEAQTGAAPQNTPEGVTPPDAGPHPPGSVIQGVPVPPPGGFGNPQPAQGNAPYPTGSAQGPARGGPHDTQGPTPSGLVPAQSPPRGGPITPLTRRSPSPADPAGRVPQQADPAGRIPQQGDPGRVPQQGDPGRRMPGHGDPAALVPSQADPPGRLPRQGELAPMDAGGPFRQPPFAAIQVQEPPKSKRALFATLGVLVLAGVATGGFFAVRSANTAAPANTAASAPTASPTSAPSVTPSAEPSGTSMLNSEITDPKTLSLKEAFPDKKVDAAGAAFTRVKSTVADDCEDAASGPFAEALKEQQCSRVLRATYVDRKRRYAVTTGIAVLPSKDAALKVDQAKNLSRNLWFRGLAGPEGSGGDRVHIAGGYAAGLVWGRYIVFSYATHADGHTPGDKEKTLVKVSSEFRDETAKVLERRITDN